MIEFKTVFLCVKTVETVPKDMGMWAVVCGMEPAPSIRRGPIVNESKDHIGFNLDSPESR